MEFSVVKTKRRGKHLICENFIFKKKIKSKDFQYYKCVNPSCSSKLSLNIINISIKNKPSSHNQFEPEQQLSETYF